MPIKLANSTKNITHMSKMLSAHSIPLLPISLPFYFEASLTKTSEPSSSVIGAKVLKKPLIFL